VRHLAAATLLCAALAARADGAPAAEPAPAPGSGEVEPAELGAYSQAQQGGLTACYQDGLKKRPKLHGRVTVRFTIQPSGDVADVTVRENTLRAPEVVACIVKRIGAWKTPFRPAAAATVELPFNFQVR
jgi:TonB family protein